MGAKRHVRPKEEDMKNLKVFVLVMFLFVIIIHAEWNHAKTVFDFSGDDSVLVGGYGSLSGKWYKSSGPQGIVVDPNGRIWVAMHYGFGPNKEGKVEFLGTGEYDTCHYKPLYCFNPDGTPAPFSPITVLDFPGGLTDTLYAESEFNGSGKGISLDKDGNILYVSYCTVYKINYQTGEGINYFIPSDRGSLTEAVQDYINGFIYVGYVVPSGRPIYLLDENLEMIGNVIDEPHQIMRTLAVRTTNDGTHLYNGTCWSGNGVMHWFSEDPEFVEFTPVDTIGNIDTYIDENDSIYYDVKLWSSSLDWTPEGNLLVGSLRQSWAGPLGSKWWIIDPVTGEYLDSFGEPAPDPESHYVRGYELIPGGVNGPRGGFFTDSHTLYTVDFYMNTLDKWTGFPTVVEEWSIQLSVSTDTYTDTDNYIGTSFGASDGFDPDIDLPEPPPPTSNYVQLYFPHPEWGEALVNFKKDIKYPVDLLYFQKIWDFTVATDQVGQLHTIETLNLSGIDYETGVYIIDQATEEIIQLSTSFPAYTFTPSSAGEYYFQILAGRLYPVLEITLDCTAGWNMLCLPLKPLTNSFDELFGDDIADMSYLYEYDGNTGYNQIGYMYQGKGYWLGLLSDETLIYIGDSVAIPVTMSLREGNNLIGNPFKYTIDKTDMSFTKETVTLSYENAVLNNWISDALYHWENNAVGVYLPADTLATWWGSWMTALTDGVSLNFNPHISEKNSIVASNKTESGSGWITSLKIMADWGSDVSSSFGMRSDASDGFDAKYDYPEPPLSPTGKFLTGYFEHPDWNKSFANYDRDIRELSETVTRWNYKIRSSNEGKVRIFWSIQNFPAGNSLVLVDQETNTMIDMTSQSFYEFDYKGTTDFEIVMNSTTSIDKNQTLPTEYAISQNYPNPFNPVTTIDYQLPENTDVRLDVYNLLGQLVMTLVDQKQTAGYYSIRLDGSELSTGIYIYKIDTGAYQKIKKCILVK